MIDRKIGEVELHDHLRGDYVDDEKYQANNKFYSISESNRNYIRKWILDRYKGKRILDYCCGNGGFTVWLAENCTHAHGIDISPISIESAKKRAHLRGAEGKIDFYVMDAEATDFPKSSFDLVVVNGVLHHLDLNRAYQELSRILKPNGEVICTEALRHNIFINLYRKMTPHLRSPWEVEHILGRKEIKMAEDYFDRVKILKFYHLFTIASVPFRNLPIFEPFRRILQAVDSVVLRIPMIKWQAWMVVFVLSHPKNLSAGA